MRIVLLVLFLATPVVAGEIIRAPDGTYVNGLPVPAPDGTYVGSDDGPETLPAPDGTYVRGGIRTPPPFPNRFGNDDDDDD
jgi:hypothetical protein